VGEKMPPSDASIGKFDILATCTYALLDGLDDAAAERRGMVAAIMGAQARLGIRYEHHEKFPAQEEAAEKKRKSTITCRVVRPAGCRQVWTGSSTRFSCRR
jgi:hypothetical protein